jgi:predicted MFS family arabinose efflux permease
VSTAASAAVAPARLVQARWALLLGNFAIGCGVMVAAGSLNDLTRSLAVSVAVGGQLIAVAAVMMCFGAPLLAALIGGWDRRRLLTLALLWFGAGHLLSALMPSYAALLPVRALTVLGAAVFTPQAAAAMGVMAPPEQRGTAITFVFLGWSVSSVVGMPLHAYIGEAFGWRWAFALVALFSLAGAAWVWRAMPDGVQPPALSLASWRRIFTNPVLVGLVAVTALSGAGQFTVFSYFAPYYRQVLQASPAEVSFLFLWFGAFGLAGNLLLTRLIDRVGAARAVAFTLALMALSLLAWPLAAGVAGMALVIVPWALGCFSSNSAQQARAGMADPALAPAMMALNTSAIYLGQAAGAAGGGALVAASGYAALHWIGFGWMVLAIVLSAWVAKRMRAGGHAR